MNSPVKFHEHWSLIDTTIIAVITEALFIYQFQIFSSTGSWDIDML